MRITLLATAILAVGCMSPAQQPPKQEVEVNAAPCPFQRFQPLNAEGQKTGVPWSGFFALDTQTGRLCKTADWQLGESYGTLPTCLSLTHPQVGDLKKFPNGRIGEWDGKGWVAQ